MNHLKERLTGKEGRKEKNITESKEGHCSNKTKSCFGDSLPGSLLVFLVAR